MSRSLPRPTLSIAVRILWDGRLPLLRHIGVTNLEEESMTMDLLAIDLGKLSFHLYGIDARGVVFSRKVSRAKLVDIVNKMAPKTVAMEACTSAHHWGRRFMGDSRGVRLDQPALRKAVCARLEERRGRRGGNL